MRLVSTFTIRNFGKYCITDVRYIDMSSSLDPECNQAKEYVFDTAVDKGILTDRRRYDSCFLKWYSESQHAVDVGFILLAKLLQAFYEARRSQTNVSHYSCNISRV